MLPIIQLTEKLLISKNSFAKRLLFGIQTYKQKMKACSFKQKPDIVLLSNFQHLSYKKIAKVLF